MQKEEGKGVEAMGVWIFSSWALLIDKLTSWWREGEGGEELEVQCQIKFKSKSRGKFKV